MKTGVFILSYKRAERLRKVLGSLDFIPDSWKGRTYIVCREEEKNEYKDTADFFGVKTKIIPKEFTQDDPLFDWSQTMDFILDNIAIGEDYDSVVIMDDDLKFARIKEAGDNPVKASGTDMEAMLGALTYSVTDLTPLAGISTRGFVVARGSKIISNKTVAAVFGMKVSFFKEHPEFRFFNPKVRFMGDRYICISLLQAGWKNIVFSEFTYDSVTNQPGGCSTHRTNSLHNESALNMKKMFPDIVDLRVKTNLGDTRLDLRIDWEKAYKEKS